MHVGWYSLANGGPREPDYALFQNAHAPQNGAQLHAIPAHFFQPSAWGLDGTFRPYSFALKTRVRQSKVAFACRIRAKSRWEERAGPKLWQKHGNPRRFC